MVKQKRQDLTKKTSTKRKNSPRCKDPPDLWPNEVWDLFRVKLEVENNNKNGKPYWREVTSRKCPIPNLEPCTRTGSSSRQITVVYNKMEYQRPVYRMRFLLKERNLGHNIRAASQASHLCINKHGDPDPCTTPSHMTSETDDANKERQRCAGWIWICSYNGHKGGYWYPTCKHEPACKVWTPKSVIPTLLRKEK